MAPRYLKNIEYYTNDNNDFEYELETHLGEIVTVFTTSGGVSGSGFTGVLLSVKPSYIKLISQIGPPPSLIIGNHHNTNKYNRSTNRSNRDKTNIYSIMSGSAMIIPIDKIVSLAYNML